MSLIQAVVDETEDREEISAEDERFYQDRVTIATALRRVFGDEKNLLDENVDLMPIAPFIRYKKRAIKKQFKPTKPAEITMIVPDAYVKNFKGPREERDLIVLVKIPRKIADSSASSIVPGKGVKI